MSLLVMGSPVIVAVSDGVCLQLANNTIERISSIFFMIIILWVKNRHW
tara:strand:+ start:24 stop:167 length:144 start_codon:yes stop_codon:yes gene_type:complete